MNQPAALQLTKQLIAIPSFVDGATDETALADFLCDWAKTNLPELVIEKQFLPGLKRYNVLLRGKNAPKLFVLGHIDTVAPHEGWLTNPLEAIVEDGQVYGLGAADIKGSIAAFLTALAERKSSVALDDLMVLFYVDEEYDFAGIEHFLTTPAMASLNPQLIISLCAELEMASGCRGDIEMSFDVVGQSGHASNPANGRNAITGAVDVFRAVEAELLTYTDEHLGVTTGNLSDLRAGSGQGNVIPGTATVTFEFRPSTKAVTADLVLELIRAEAASRHLAIQNVSVRHDIAPWPTNFDAPEFKIIEQLYAEAGVPFAPASRALKGYIDIQMITERLDVPAYLIGLGGPNMHAPNESASLQQLGQATDLFSVLLPKFLPR